MITSLLTIAVAAQLSVPTPESVLLIAASITRPKIKVPFIIGCSISSVIGVSMFVFKIILSRRISLSKYQLTLMYESINRELSWSCKQQGYIGQQIHYSMFSVCKCIFAVND